jgi:hypothetical protein
MMSPKLQPTKKGKKSRFAPTIPLNKQFSQGDMFMAKSTAGISPKFASPFSKYTNSKIINQETLKKLLKDKTDQENVKDSSLDISYLDYTDIDLLSLRNSTTNYLTLNEEKMLYKHVWAMFSNTQIVDSYMMSPYTFSKFIQEANRYYSKNKNPFHNF